MQKKRIIFSNHAVTQMFQRNITVEEVKYILQNGVIVNEYPDDKPYPSRLMYAVCNNRNLHVVYSESSDEAQTIIITAYEASSDIWEDDFITRKK